MREINFRAWDSVIEEFIYSNKYPSMWRYFKELEDRGIRHFESQQYTGLKDKNGVEIYEGDFLQRYTSSGNKASFGKVVFTNLFRWSVTVRRGDHPLYTPDGNKNHKYSVGLYKWTNPSESSSTFEVIGNIYENPELLEIKQNE